MIGARKTENIYLIRDLPFLQKVSGLLFIVLGIGLLIWHLTNWFSGTESWKTVSVLAGIGFLGLGFFILHVTPNTITIINKELKVVTVEKRGFITTSYTQYGFDELGGPIRVEELSWSKGLFALYSIHLPLKDFLSLRLTGSTHFFPDIHTEIVTDANIYLQHAFSTPKTDSAESTPS